jgi:uncharacterized membrane protein YtjA (UPF0391 family)
VPARRRHSEPVAVTGACLPRRRSRREVVGGTSELLFRLSPTGDDFARPSERTIMSALLKWALIFLVVSLVAALFGFTGISEASSDIARVLFYIFLVIFLILLILGVTIFRKVSG